MCARHALYPGASGCFSSLKDSAFFLLEVLPLSFESDLVLTGEREGGDCEGVLDFSFLTFVRLFGGIIDGILGGFSLSSTR